MTQHPVRPGIRALEALGLTVFFATALFLAAILVTWIVKGPGGTQGVALVVSTACAVLGVLAMLVDSADLWVMGRRMSPSTVRIVRYFVFGAILAAVIASIFGRNSVLVLYLFPSMLIYLFIARRGPTLTRAAEARRASGGRRGTTGGSRGGNSTASRSGSSAGSGSGGGVKARQRRGGKKHR